MNLHALSSLDGRYAETSARLSGFFSEFAFIRDRVKIELDYLRALSKIGLFRPLTDSESARIDSVISNFSDADAESIRAHERATRHDVKAIEYFLREKLRDPSESSDSIRLSASQSDIQSDLLSWIHFGLTSEDVNSVAQALALRDAHVSVMLPTLNTLLDSIRDFALRYRALPMLARTHGQFAVPTTFGKEFAVYLARLKKTRDDLSVFRFEAKLTGAVGNFNALKSAAPQIDWLSFSADFIKRYDLEPNLLTTQILPYDNWIRFFDLLRLTNSILIDFSQDIWRYISDGYLKQSVVEGEVGSSTMPQKVNPIDFENAEGNLGLANSLFAHYAQKLTVSRLQRDLSDSTVRRTFGSALGHTLLAWTNLLNGMKRIAPDESKLTSDLNAHWEVIAEGAQTILRAAGRSDAYESLKAQTRGRVLTESDYQTWLKSIDVNDETRARLRTLSPQTYIGLAAELVNLT